jgi:hypothetical protein
VAMAVVNTAEHEDNSCLEEIQSTEKVCWYFYLIIFMSNKVSPSGTMQHMVIKKKIREI